MKWKKNRNIFCVKTKLSSVDAVNPKYRVRLFLKRNKEKPRLKGVKLLFKDLAVGIENEDFIRDLYTVLIRYTAYKKPRIIK